MRRQDGTTTLDLAFRGVTVAEVMTREVIVLRIGSTIANAVKTLVTHRIDGAPVVDGARVLGVVSKSDLLYSAGDGDELVERVMTPVVFAVHPSDPVPAAVRLMLTARVHRALVIDDHQLVGILSPLDMLAALDRQEGSEATFGCDSSRPVAAVPVGQR